MGSLRRGGGGGKGRMGGEGLSRAVPDNPFHPWGVVTDQIAGGGGVGVVKVDPHDPPASNHPAVRARHPERVRERGMGGGRGGRRLRPGGPDLV